MKAIVKPIDLPPGRRVLVLSDIHGNLPFLKGVLEKARFSRDDILIVLGDILERNEGSLDTLRYVMALSQTHTVYTILGNCDNLVLDFVDNRGDLNEEFFHKRWFTLGERSVLVKMAHLAGAPIDTPADYPAARSAIARAFKPELDFLRGLPHIYVNQDYLFVHGGVPREDRLEELEAFGIMKNDDFWNQGHSFRRWVIVGHWPVTLYRTDIPSAAPIIDREKHIISIDGGCVLKWDGQLNALILPEKPDGEFSWVSYDGFPELTALDPQETNPDPFNIRYGHSRLEVLERGELLSRCR
ncbi:MAG: metallophosphoesterase, partial [Oscillospiraceae bacterium]|nr:metallophosphoesterase [Oscillospiraceae bacterium]